MSLEMELLDRSYTTYY